MTVHFSDQFGSPSSLTVAPATSYPDPYVAAPADIAHVNVKRKHCRIHMAQAATLVAADKIYICTLRSGDRLQEILFSNTSTWAAAALTFDLGLWKAGESGQHDGAVIVGDLFADGDDLLATLTREDLFLQSTDLTDLDRGRTLWELADIGAATYTEDPDEDWDLIMTIATATTITVQAEILMEVEYTPRVLG